MGVEAHTYERRIEVMLDDIGNIKRDKLRIMLGIEERNRREAYARTKHYLH